MLNFSKFLDLLEPADAAPPSSICSCFASIWLIGVHGLARFEVVKLVANFPTRRCSWISLVGSTIVAV